MHTAKHSFRVLNRRMGLELVGGLFGTLLLNLLLTGCPQTGGADPATIAAVNASSSSTTTTGFSTTSSVNALQIITKADPTGSFNSVLVPAAGGASVIAQRIYDLNGSLITSGNIPSWYSESRVFLTSTRTSAGAPTNTTSNTPCAYFDAYGDNNPDSTAFYTVDGYNAAAGTAITSDIDQCAGTAAAELNQLAMYVKVDRRFMNSSDKLQVIVKAKLIDEPNVAPTASSCVVGGFFNAAACSNAVFNITMRTAPGAAAQPFYLLFPSAKATDVLSENVLLPIHLNTGITTISIDRVKGGAVIYGVTVVRL